MPTEKLTVAIGWGHSRLRTRHSELTFTRDPNETLTKIGRGRRLNDRRLLASAEKVYLSLACFSGASVSKVIRNSPLLPVM